jgi:hypothetical protein
MRTNYVLSLLPAALAITTFVATMVVEAPDAKAVVYCKTVGVPKGCVVRRPVVRRSDVMLKHDISLLGHLDNGLGFYRFSYNGSGRAYVGVLAQEVLTVMPGAVVRGNDGYLRVSYDRLGLQFQTYDQWIASGARVPAGAPVEH